MKKPKIRFKGFTETWEQRKLGNIMEVASVKRIHRKDWTDSGVRFLRARDIVSHFKNEKQNDCLYISKEKYDECSALSGKVSVGDLLVTGVGTIGIPYLVNDLNPIYFKDGNIIWFKNGSKINGFFLYYSFIGNEIQNFINVLSGTGTVGTYTIESGKKTSISLPDKLEQQKIGNFLKHLDHLITLHQRKCENLKKLKKFMLQKLFPQNGENVPKVRFLNFTDTWEQRKFKNIVERLSESYMSDDKNPSVEYEDIISELGTINKDIFNKRIRKNGIKFSNNEILYGKLRPYLHNWLKPDFNGIAVGDWWVLKPINCDREFIFRLIQTSTFDNIANQSNGTKMPRADWNLIANSDFYLPISIYEQKQIGSLFSKLDHLITLHQSKCDKLKEVKKYMLQNMFI